MLQILTHGQTIIALLRSSSLKYHKHSFRPQITKGYDKYFFESEMTRGLPGHLPTQSTTGKKLPERTYRRRTVKDSPIQAQGKPQDSGRVTEHNFALRLLEVAAARPAVFEEQSSGEEDPEDCTKKRSCVKNVHELLESGGSSRLYDELDYMVSGLERLLGDTSQKGALVCKRYLSEMGCKFFTSFSPLQMSRFRSSGLIDRVIKALSPPFGRDGYAMLFLASFLFLTCHDVRRIDHYFGLEDGVLLVEWLLPQAGTLRESEWTRDDTGFFSLPSIPRVPPLPEGLVIFLAKNLRVGHMDPRKALSGRAGIWKEWRPSAACCSSRRASANH